MNEITYFVTLITTLLNEIILTYNRRTSLLAKTLPRHGKKHVEENKMTLNIIRLKMHFKE